ncbi:acyl-CoA dehydrogenase [Geobacter metallireducens GS-15]|uniref:3-methylmercaptopropionyl-CoA dehydrogenase n=1 Tax=Geobacter metallireducens (strain ATCC 53774 / DSM 7210 / GS-15) TaxID=269799 RepID=Q39TC8_GEOMG|nr:acyl-CoA dehydrogenase [Geobacter metallireducens]ABB32496.1 acyl-CoA dehydrogenase [Geobacter metallireducens GS-15]
MANLLVDKRDQIFVLKEMLEIDRLCSFPRYASHAGYEMVLNEAHTFANTELSPTAVDGDQQGCLYDPKTKAVTFPQSFHKPYQKFCEGGWLTMCDSPDVGGDGFPSAVGTAVSEVFYACGFYIYGAAELTHAAAKVIEAYGSEEQKKSYMTKLFAGEWMGTMCLTEPDAGSEVGAVQTVATRNGDGSYAITGTKIFITAGEHDLAGNIIHMVLARVAGDPPGTKGLSLFIVPKFLPDGVGNAGERNDVYCTGIEHKMGLHGLVTCTMAFGDSGKCTGYLLGEQGKGMAEMFHMMNEQRLLVGVEGLSFSTSAFMNAVDYTKSRVQGLSVYPGADKQKSVAIINHPDVKRMLLTMKAYVEGCRSLAYFTSSCMDNAGVADGADRARWQGLVELLTPIVKAYITDNAWTVTALAMQCAGGYGYCSDYPFERLARDCKVTTIFEGTNGIQAMDLMFRKILGNNRVNFNNLLEMIDQTIEKGAADAEISVYAAIVKRAREGLARIVEEMAASSAAGNSLDLYAKTSPFLEAMGDVLLGWLHLWQLTVANPKLQGFIENKSEDEIAKILNKNKNAAFYDGKVLGARFFIGTLLMNTFGKFEQIRSGAAPVISIGEKSFTG